MISGSHCQPCGTARRGHVFPGQTARELSSYVSGDPDAVQQQGLGNHPRSLRERHGLHEDDEVDVIEGGETLRIVRAEASSTRGQRLVHRMRGRALPR
jgi:hypothetical protein